MVNSSFICGENSKKEIVQKKFKIEEGGKQRPSSFVNQNVHF